MPVSGAWADRTKNRMPNTPIAPRRSWRLGGRSGVLASGRGAWISRWVMGTPRGVGFRRLAGRSLGAAVMRTGGGAAAAWGAVPKLSKWTVVSDGTYHAPRSATGQVASFSERGGTAGQDAGRRGCAW